jgi:hypothetical protein
MTRPVGHSDWSQEQDYKMVCRALERQRTRLEPVSERRSRILFVLHEAKITLKNFIDEHRAELTPRLILKLAEGVLLMTQEYVDNLRAECAEYLEREEREEREREAQGLKANGNGKKKKAG